MKKVIRSMKKAGTKMAVRMALAVENHRGSGYVDQAVVIMISIVVGAVLLAGLYALFGDTILPTLTQKIEDMFTYSGT